MNFILSRLTLREQRIMAYVCVGLIVFIPSEYYFNSGYILVGALSGNPVYADLSSTFWIGTALSGAAWLVCVWYVVCLIRRS